jgi:hypothetical protein
MPPSKKIFVGASAVITGVLCQMIVAWLLTRSLDPLQAMQGAGSSYGELVDQRLEQIHSQTAMRLNAITMSWLFILSGMIFLLIGVYQTARCVEAFQAVPGKEP